MQYIIRIFVLSINGIKNIFRLMLKWYIQLVNLFCFWKCSFFVNLIRLKFQNVECVFILYHIIMMCIKYWFPSNVFCFYYGSKFLSNKNLIQLAFISWNHHFLLNEVVYFHSSSMQYITSLLGDYAITDISSCNW